MVSSSPSTSDGDSEEEEVSLWRRDDDKFTGETTEFSESVSEDVSQANRKQRVSSGEVRKRIISQSKCYYIFFPVA